MSNSSKPDLSKVFSSPDTGKLLIVCVGNELRGDDAVGPYIAESSKSQIVNAGERPEAAYDIALEIKPSKVVFIDAADFGGQPGQIEIIPEDNVPSTTLSTHAIPLNAVAALIKNDMQCDIVFLGIQVKDVSVGAVMCDEVKSAADKIIGFLQMI